MQGHDDIKLRKPQANHPATLAVATSEALEVVELIADFAIAGAAVCRVRRTSKTGRDRGNAVAQAV